MNDINLNEHLNYLKLNHDERRKFIDNFLKICEPNDLNYMTVKLDEYKKDFISLLPIEIVENILGYLDWKSLLNCCQVNTVWNYKLSNNFNRLWFSWCKKLLPINESNYDASTNTSYKEAFVDLLRHSTNLENGKLFRTWQVGPAEINALSSYKNIIATATHVVKFWRLEEIINDDNISNATHPTSKSNTLNYKWNDFKSIHLNSRASSFKFDDHYLVASTYFLTIDLYSMETGEFLHQYMGHTCSITSFDFSPYLMLIVSGGADNTIKYWSMKTKEINTEKNNFNLLIKSEPNLIWPVKVNIEKFKDDLYLVLVLCANGFLFLNLVEKIEDFIIDDKNKNNFQPNIFDRFNFRYNLIISDTFKSYLSLHNELDGYFNSDDEDYDQYLNDNYNSDDFLLSNKSRMTLENNKLTVFAITDNNANQTKKFFIKKWNLNEDLNLEFEIVPTEYKHFEFLNKRNLNSIDINQFEIISFGFNYCLLLDENNNFYLSNLKNKKIKSIQNGLNFDNKTTKAFRLMSSNTQEQFLFGDQRWLNGYDVGLQKGEFLNKDDSFVFAFYTKKRNEIFIVHWNLDFD